MILVVLCTFEELFSFYRVIHVNHFYIHSTHRNTTRHSHSTATERYQTESSKTPNTHSSIKGHKPLANWQSGTRRLSGSGPRELRFNHPRQFTRLVIIHEADLSGTCMCGVPTLWILSTARIVCLQLFVHPACKDTSKQSTPLSLQH